MGLLSNMAKVRTESVSTLNTLAEKPKIDLSTIGSDLPELPKKESNYKRFILEVGFLLDENNKIVSTLEKGMDLSQYKWVRIPQPIYLEDLIGKGINRFNDSVSKQKIFPSRELQILTVLGDNYSKQLLDLCQTLQPQEEKQLTPNLRLCNRTRLEKKELEVPEVQALVDLI